MSATFHERPVNFGEALKLASMLLSRNGLLVRRGSIASEAEQIVCGAYRTATGNILRRADLYLRIGDRYPDAAGDALISLAISRGEGKLLQHLLGSQVFVDHEYKVSPAVLIPRPETEVLFQEARSAIGSSRLGLEVGIGSGILSIELLSASPSLRMIATDVSAAALEIAQENAIRILGPLWHERLHLIHCFPGEVLEPFMRLLGSLKADFLISNPPYLESEAEAEADVATQEPSEALFAPPGDPLYFYRTIAQGAGKLLKPQSAGVFVEIPHEREAEVVREFQFQNWQVALTPDLTGRSRVLKGVKPNG